jgi:hypothetical protein
MATISIFNSQRTRINFTPLSPSDMVIIVDGRRQKCDGTFAASVKNSTHATLYVDVPDTRCLIYGIPRLERDKALKPGASWSGTVKIAAFSNSCWLYGGSARMGVPVLALGVSERRYGPINVSPVSKAAASAAPIEFARVMPLK